MQHLYAGPEGLRPFRRIHAPPLVRAPVNSFEFHPCEHTPQAVHSSRLLRYPDRSGHLVHIVYCADYQGI